MTYPVITFYIETVLTTFAVLAALFKWKDMDLVGKVYFVNLAWYMIVNTLGCWGFFHKDFYARFHAPLYILDKTSPLTDYVTCAIFLNYATPQFRRKHIGIIAAVVGLTVWIGYFIVYFKTENYNDYFVSLEGTALIILCLVSIYFMQKDNYIGALKKMPAFWFVFTLLFYWVTTYFYFLEFNFIMTNPPLKRISTIMVHRIIEIQLLAIGIVYLSYPKKMRNG
jgi:hypothetical protein